MSRARPGAPHHRGVAGPGSSLSIRDGAIAAWPGAWQGKNLRDVLDALGYDVDRPWRELPAEAREWILFTDEQPVVTVHPVREAGRIQRPYQGTYMSARRYVLKTFADSKSATLRAKAERFLNSAPCPVCGGGRLRAEALAVTVGGRTVAELAALPLAELPRLLPTEGEAAKVLAEDLISRIAPVVELGLGYLSLDRPTPPCRRASCSGCGWRPSCAPACSASCTSSTSPRRDCTRRTRRRS